MTENVFKSPSPFCTPKRDNSACKAEVETPTWKTSSPAKFVKSPSSLEVEIGSPLSGLYGDARRLDDIHRAILSLHSRIDDVEYTMRQFIDTSYIVRRSTSSHYTTASSESDSIQFHADDCSLLEHSVSSKGSTTAQGIIESENSAAQHSEGEGFHPRQKTLDSTCQELGMSPNLVKVLDRESGSRKNLASKLVRQVFSLTERGSSNVMGLKGKCRLDPKRIELVQSLTFALRPMKPGENEDHIWKKECVKAIDSANRNCKY